MENTPLVPKQRKNRWRMLGMITITVLAVLLGFTGSFVLMPILSTPQKIDSKRIQTMRVHVSKSKNGSFLPHVEFNVLDTDFNAHAFATFNDSVHEIGWSQLWVRANPNTSEFEASMYAAGFAEGALTHHRILEHYLNTYDYFYGNDTSAPIHVNAFFTENLAWMRSQVAARSSFNESESLYWQTVGGILAQLDGLTAGYNAYSQHKLTTLDFFFMSSDGDIPTIITVTKAVDLRLLFHKPSVDNFKCSALIRLTKNDLLWGHTTWDTYTALNKMFKHYDIPIPHPTTSTANRRISMSSSPGYLSSVDDWYLLDNGLSILETTNGNFNTSLFEFVQPASCLSWIRTKVANAIATTGNEWTILFAKYNSGTYNNQWMILDTRLYVNGTMLPGGLHLLEQIPGEVRSSDVTGILNSQKYWASYNIPYDTYIYKKSGFASKHGDNWSYKNCTRAKIFARDAPHVETLQDLKRIMRYNDYKHDPLSDHNPSHAIASRYDLELNFSLFDLNGAIDAKVTTIEKFKRLECDTILGPTTDQQPPFKWTEKYKKIASHRGHPLIFNFSYVTMGPIS